MFTKVPYRFLSRIRITGLPRSRSSSGTEILWGISSPHYPPLATRDHFLPSVPTLYSETSEQQPSLEHHFVCFSEILAFSRILERLFCSIRLLNVESLAACSLCLEVSLHIHNYSARGL